MKSYYLIGLLALVILINYIDRGAIAFAIEPIKDEFLLNNTEFGFIASAFGIGYLITALVSGWLVDLYGAKKNLAVAVIIWSLAMVLMGFSNGFWMLFLSRVLLGLGEGPVFPALSKFVHDGSTKEVRGKALSFALISVPLATLISSPLITYFIFFFNWRIVFIFLGALGLVWLLLFICYFKFLHRGEGSVEKGNELTKDSISWRYILSHPPLLANYFAMFSFGYTLFFALIWMPGYLQETYQINLKELGQIVMLPWLLSIFGILFGGFFSDWLWKKKKSVYLSRVCMIWVPQLVSCFFFLAIIFIHDLKINLFLLSIGLALTFVLNAPIYALHAEIIKPHVGIGQGIMTGCLAIAGIVSPVVTGWVTQMSGNYNTAFGIILLLMLISSQMIRLSYRYH